jgi:hypothetical protein
MYGRFAIAAALVLSAGGSPAYGQNPNYPGYLGVFVVEGNGGMRINGFIPNTPAEELSLNSEMNRYDTIVKLAGRPTRSLSELRFARNQILDGHEAKMLLRTRQGDYYHVWITRSPAVVMSTGPGGTSSSAAPSQGAPDRFKYGGTGQGGSQDIRRIGGDGEEGDSVGSPAPKAPAPRGNASPDDDGPDIRPKKN